MVRVAVDARPDLHRGRLGVPARVTLSSRSERDGPRSPSKTVDRRRPEGSLSGADGRHARDEGGTEGGIRQ